MKRAGDCSGVSLVAIACLMPLGGCQPTASKPVSSPALPEAFFEAEKSLPGDEEWRCELVSQQDGAINFRVTSQQSGLDVNVFTDEGYNLYLNNRGALDIGDKKYVLWSVTTSGRKIERKITIPKGTIWFVIRCHQQSELKLQCFRE